MTPLIPQEALFPVWLVGTLIAFFGWFAFGRSVGMRGKVLGELWRPATYFAIMWPLYLVFAICLLPLLALFRILGLNKRD